MVPSPTSSSSTADETWRLIERQLEDIARSLEHACSQDEFYESLLQRTVAALAAEAGRVWRRQGTKDPIILAQHGWIDSATAPANDDRLLATMDRAMPLSLAPGERAADVINRYQQSLMLQPVVVDGRCDMLLEVLLAADLTADGRQTAQDLLSAIAELAADFERRHRIRQLESLTQRLRQETELSQRIHQRLDLKPTALAIVNDGRHCAGCDRLSLLVPHRGRTTALAVSGVDQIDRRSRQIVLLQNLAREIIRQGEPLRFDGDSSQLPPELERSIQEYVDQSHTKRLVAVPLQQPDAKPSAGRSPAAIGLLVAEDFTATGSSDELLRRLQTAAGPSSTALANAIRYDSIPLRTLLTGLSNWGRRPATVAGGAALVALVALTFCWPITFSVPARGELQPAVRQQIYAPEEAVVDQVLVDHGDRVDRDQPLLQLSSASLDQELTRVEGDLQTTQQLLEAVKAKRFLAGSGQPRAADTADQLAAEEEGLKQRITALNDQAHLLRDRRHRLRLESPIAGQVLTWNATELLKSRPVQPGQRLVTVADPAGPWLLELEVADRDVRHVLDAQASQQDPLRVEFTLATNPNIVYRGRLANVSARSESLQQQRPTVQVSVEIDAQQVQPLRPGSTVVAKIICGKRSAAYVWLHHVWESIQLYILF